MDWNDGNLWDLKACLDHNRTVVRAGDILNVLAVSEGGFEGPAWWWIVYLKDGRFALVKGLCGFTGWDGCSSAVAQFASSPEQAVSLAGEAQRESLDIQLTAGLRQTRRAKVVEQLAAAQARAEVALKLLSAPEAPKRPWWRVWV